PRCALLPPPPGASSPPPPSGAPPPPRRLAAALPPPRCALLPPPPGASSPPPPSGAPPPPRRLCGALPPRLPAPPPPPSPRAPPRLCNGGVGGLVERRTRFREEAGCVGERLTPHRGLGVGLPVGRSRQQGASQVRGGGDPSALGCLCRSCAGLHDGRELARALLRDP